MKLVRTDGVYRTEDGRFEIQINPGYSTWCDDPHPMRYKVEGNERLLARVNYMARRYFKKGVEYFSYQCPGGEEHEYSRWIVWDVLGDDYPEGTSPDGFDTFRDAKSFLSDLLTKGQS